MSRRALYGVAKALEGAGMVIVLVGLLMSINEGMRDEGLKSMESEMRGLMIGGGLFVLGVLIEKRIGSR